MLFDIFLFVLYYLNFKLKYKYSYFGFDLEFILIEIIWVGNLFK